MSAGSGPAAASVRSGGPRHGPLGATHIAHNLPSLRWRQDTVLGPPPFGPPVCLIAGDTQWAAATVRLTPRTRLSGKRLKNPQSGVVISRCAKERLARRWRFFGLLRTSQREHELCSIVSVMGKARIGCRHPCVHASQAGLPRLKILGLHLTFQCITAPLETSSDAPTLRSYATAPDFPAQRERLAAKL